SKSLRDRARIPRFGNAHAPLDESLVRCVLDFSNRPHVVWEMAPLCGRINDFDVSVLGEFVRGYAQTAGISMHVDYLRGENLHHIAEAAFKAMGLATREALERLGGGAIPSLRLRVEGGDGGGGRPGLGLLRGRLPRIQPRRGKVAHMGRDRLGLGRPSPLLRGGADGTWAYFVHSYAAPAEGDDVIAG